MRVGRLKIDGFGPLTKVSLDLAPCMTVIYGPNEAGKTTWHAALYAALCGMRRGPGMRSEDRQFMERHRPWDGGRWAVSAEVELADGRVVEIKQDLEGRIDCSAIDNLGRDVSSEILFEGCPDASRWLGLDRRVFLATACVRQAEVQDVKQHAAGLQEHLQRAAATAGTDATAARALELIENAIRTRIGREAANAVRPLRLAMNAVEPAERRVATVQTAHSEYIRLLGRLQEARASADAEERRVYGLEASAAEIAARNEAMLLVRVEEILSRYPAGPPSAPKDDALANEVAGALAEWQSRPTMPAIEGKGSTELRRDIEALPPMPDGDLEPAPDVVTAQAALQAAYAALSGHMAAKPPDVAPPTATLAPAELLDLAARIDLPIPQSDPALRGRVETLRQRVVQPRSHAIAYGLAAGSALLVLGAGGAIAISFPILAAVAIAGAIGLVVAAMLRFRGDSVTGPMVELRDLESRLAQAEATIAAVETRRQSARESIASLGLPQSADQLRALASAVEQADRGRMIRSQWEIHRTVLEDGWRIATNKLVAALRSRAVNLDGSLPPEHALQQYVTACQQRSQQAHAASHRRELEGLLATRGQLEAAADNAVKANQAAKVRIEATANACGIEVTATGDPVAGLRTWQAAREEKLIALQTATHEWSEMQTLMAGRDPERLRADAAAQRDRAAKLAQRIGANEVSPDEAAVAGLPEQRRRSQEASQLVASLEGQLSTIEPATVDVSQAEENLESSRSELAKVRKLEAILVKAKEYLEVAQDRVHRTVAPVLTSTLKQWMPTITEGKWSDALVDPETLDVRVRPAGGDWREAAFLSEGTREQIYLLLRMAMVKHLTHGSETCPLILDDVTIHSDSTRKKALLDLLLSLSSDRQIILFAQESEVRDWANTHLVEPSHRLHTLAITSNAAISASGGPQQ